MQIEPLIQPWTHWAIQTRGGEKLYLVVDSLYDALGKVVLMEVKEYPEGAQRTFQQLYYADFIMQKEKNLIKPFTPKL